MPVVEAVPPTSDPTELRVRASRTMACPAVRVWGALTRPSCLETMHPFVARHETPDLPLRAGVTDTVVYHSGRRLERRYVEWIDGRRGAVDVTIHGMPGEPVGHAHTVMELEDAGAGCTMHVTIVLRSARQELRDLQEQMIRQYLDQMLQGFAFHCETGEPVRRDQFGTHPFYS